MKFIFSLTFCSLMAFTGMAAGSYPARTKPSSKTYISNYENVLGTSMEVKMSSASEKQAAIAEAAALAEIDRLSKILSAYDASSEFSKWAKTSGVAVKISKELYEVLNLFDQWRLQTKGALDASAALVSKVWKESALKGSLPAAAELQNAVAEIRQQHWQLDAKTQTATHLTNTPLILNSFAKSYIIRAAATAAMNAAHLNGIVVNIGGDMVIAGDVKELITVSDPKADAENDLPLDRLMIADKAIATSGNYRRGEMINGQWYSHIVDPRTGQPADAIISATVVSPSATDAGALATAFNVMKPEESIALAATMPGVDYLIITKNGERIESKNWKNLEAPLLTVANKIAADKEWKSELVIGLELARPQGFAKRPFAAVWIEDKDGQTVKTISLWYNKPRWLHDLRAWYRKNGDSFNADPSGMASSTSATRSPGTYTLKWDGKDDKGNVVKQGIYTVYIEVVREHGGYDLLHQEINCNDKAQQYNLKGNVEIAGAAIDYRKK